MRIGDTICIIFAYVGTVAGSAYATSVNHVFPRFCEVCREQFRHVLICAYLLMPHIIPDSRIARVPRGHLHWHQHGCAHCFIDADICSLSTCAMGTNVSNIRRTLNGRSMSRSHLERLPSTSLSRLETQLELIGYHICPDIGCHSTS